MLHIFTVHLNIGVARNFQGRRPSNRGAEIETPKAPRERGRGEGVSPSPVWGSVVSSPSGSGPEARPKAIFCAFEA